MTDTEALATIATLSQEFGVDTYVKGGGGNTSCKNADTLFIKPSGITLAQLRPKDFLAIDRAVLDGLYETDFPTDANGREAAVAAFMTTTVRPGYSGRPSVETPLHNTFPQRFVVHTHPAEVNGMTCGNDGAAACASLFPKALWVEFSEPGYTLCMQIRAAMAQYEKEQGHAPEILFLENHGVFIAHDDADGVRNLYEQVMYGVRNRIADATLNTLPAKKPLPAPDRIDAVHATLRDVVGPDAAHIVQDGFFAVPDGGISPDHIVYCKGSLFFGEPTPESLRAFHDRHGYWPRVVVTDDAVFGLGATAKSAGLALELAWDGALVAQYAGAFGGLHLLEPRFVDFIENWEVESYRQKAIQ